ncbi:SGNH/GDSL hydrolase family protein [Pontibacter sp. E15-1]|uniref:SGNH/GDSL hydrolase family protein n=1 Tax=Pontibacter sp. E15-1 TaxID=2919918 RepID=UPI001F4FFA05|nr:SGNH/GDSL hydrolase family protein [Pontibacter sp. E15-1]MCJ8167175.1 SGNH/GDSL hydrolase family protein [Pontibacter sp. E15-1]
MKNIFYKYSVLALSAGVLLTSCDPEIDAPSKSSGEADFAKYVAVGNSLTAGFQDNGLYLEGQRSSYPALMANQFAEVGGGSFVQPLFTEAQKNGSGYLRLSGFTATGSPITETVTENRAIRSASPVLFTKFTDPVQNLGVPGLKVADIKVQGYGSAQGNPYFERITPDAQAGQTYLQRVQQSTDHTFFSLWLGNNDVLSYATSGGASTAASNAITPVTTFDANYAELVGALMANGQEGILATIPNVAGIPFFTTVGPRVKQTLTDNNVPGMVAITGAGKDRVQFLTSQINASENGVLFTLTGASYAALLGQPTGKYWRDLAKQVSPSQDPLIIKGTLAQLLFNYSIDTTQMFGFSGGNPWPSALLLDVNEQNNVKAATSAFNTIIKAQAEARGLALWDANAYFNTIQTGFGKNGAAYSPAFITGNLFSLDGVHLTPRGYAIAANEMIQAINAKYNSNVPLVDETQYRAVLLP